MLEEGKGLEKDWILFAILDQIQIGRRWEGEWVAYSIE